MITQLQKSFSLLLACLLVLTCLSAPAATSQTQMAQEAIPDGLMSAFLAVSSQPSKPAPRATAPVPVGWISPCTPAACSRWQRPLLEPRPERLGARRADRGAAEAAIAQTDSRLEYRRGALTEWYLLFLVCARWARRVGARSGGDSMNFPLHRQAALQADANGRLLETSP